MAPRTVFYAWQAQRPGKCNRNLIQDALEHALGELAQNKEEPIEFVLDQDARDVPGAPDISTTILRKIEDCSIFVADVTPVGKLINDKLTPNPNVLFELGYAWYKLGESRIILVLNQAFGAPEDLPFDLLKRSLVLYHRAPDALDGPASVRATLSRRFRSLISTITRDDSLRPLREQGLTTTDIALFKAVYRKMLEADRGECSYQEVLQVGNSIGLDQPGVIGATQILLGLRLWDASPIIAPTRFSRIEATAPGMEQYCTAFLPDYDALTTDVRRRIVEGFTSRGEISSDELVSAVNKPEIVIVHILKRLQENDEICIAEDSEGIDVCEVKPKLKRLFEQS
jgi:hypothetical protein